MYYYYLYFFVLRVDFCNTGFWISGNDGIWTFTNPNFKYFSPVSTLFISHIILFKILIKKLNGGIKKVIIAFPILENIDDNPLNSVKIGFKIGINS